MSQDSLKVESMESDRDMELTLKIEYNDTDQTKKVHKDQKEPKEQVIELKQNKGNNYIKLIE